MDFKPRFSTLTRCIVEKDLLQDAPFSLVDVGCGGGIPELWRHFQTSLRVLGVDPQTSECRRLQAAEDNPGIRYVPRFLKLPPDHPFHQQRGDREPWTGNPWERTSAAQAMNHLRAKVAPEQQFSQLNAWDSQELAEEAATSTLDELVAEAGWTGADFVKIDVDGPDLEVLLSAEQTLRTGPALGCAIEVNFSGSADPTDNTLHNIDRTLRRWGFDLFDLSTRRCTMGALPARFRFDENPHETDLGRVLQGDALYLRDPLGWAQNEAACVELTPEQYLKLCCLYELFGTPDHAAELLAEHPETVSALTDPQDLLHLLAHQFDPTLQNYDDYVSGFRADPTSFYPSRRPPEARA